MKNIGPYLVWVAVRFVRVCFENPTGYHLHSGLTTKPVSRSFICVRSRMRILWRQEGVKALSQFGRHASVSRGTSRTGINVGVDTACFSRFIMHTASKTRSRNVLV